MSSWKALVDFPTRGDMCLDNCLTNCMLRFIQQVPPISIILSIKTDHMAVILPPGTKLKPIRYKLKSRYGIVERIVNFTLHLQRKTGIMCLLPLMFSKRFVYWKNRFMVIWTGVCQSELYLCHHAIHHG